LGQGTRLAKSGAELETRLRQKRDWSPRQWQVIEVLLLEMRHAALQRQHWRSLIAQEVLSDPLLLSIVRLCGVREMVAFALGAFVGDIKRFADPKKLVKHLGLNPAFDDSGEGRWSGGLGGHGRKDLRCLLIEAAQASLRCSKTPLARWGKKLLARKGQINLAVAVWYLMMGRWTTLEEIDAHPEPQGEQDDQPGRRRGTQKAGQNPQSLPRGNLPVAQTGAGVRPGSRPQVHPAGRNPAPVATG
jgi:hypothetical protein